MKSEARLNNLPIAPRKMRIIADLIRGLSATDAIVALGKQVRRGSEPMEKLIRSAVANAENNFGLDRDNLYVATAVVDEGTRLKRWQPHAFGRATPVIRRISKVTVILDEVVEGLNRKTSGSAKPQKKETVVIPSETEAAAEPTEAEAEVRESDAKKVEEHLVVDEKRRETAIKTEMKERKNVVKRVYQRKSF